MDKTVPGFTLVETLVSLALLGLIAGFLVNGVHHFGVLSRYGEEISKETESKLALNRLAETISGALAIKLKDQAGVDRYISFRGTKNSVQFVTYSDGTVLTAGKYFVEFTVEAVGGEGNQSGLRETWKPLVGNASRNPKLFSEISHRGFEKLNFQYLDPGSTIDGLIWLSEWQGMQILPKAMKMGLVNDTGEKKSATQLIFQVNGDFSL